MQQSSPGGVCATGRLESFYYSRGNTGESNIIKWFFKSFLGGILRGVWWLGTTIVNLLLGIAFFVISLVGRVIASVIGFALLVAGFLLSLTGIGAILGVPISIIGSFIFMKAILP